MEGFISPRSKVAQMLADIDNASTPSPPQVPRSKPLDSDTAIEPTTSVQEPSYSQSPSLSGVQTKKKLLYPTSESEDSDGDVRRPQGRAARRMLGVQGPVSRLSPVPQNNLSDDEDELYSSTPMKRYKQTEGDTAGEAGDGLFLSPARSFPVHTVPRDRDSDEDLPTNPFGSKEKLAELVAQKRAERLAKEAKERSKHASSDLPEEAIDGVDVPADAAIEKIMSDASRPARKASKKALLEMERETQRLARQQALAHQIKVKKKFTTNDLLAKFNFQRPGMPNEGATTNPAEGDTTASSAPNSDGIEDRTKDPNSTPPSSPPTPLDKQTALVEQGALSKLTPVRQDSLASLTMGDEDEDLPEIEEVLRRSQMPKSMQKPSVPQPPEDQKGLKLARLGKKAAVPQDDSSDGELEIIEQLPVNLRAFRMTAGTTRSNKQADSKAIHNLRHLSHLVANEAQPHKKGSRPSLNPKTLEGQLRRRAKEQARQQQLERIQELRAKGIEVQTVEEREQEAEAFENLLEKARLDAVELRKAEKAARKEAGDETAMQVSEDEDEDDEYVGSGSEDEEVEHGDDEQEQDENDLLDEAAEETDDDAEEEDAEVMDHESTAGDDASDQDVQQRTAAEDDFAPEKDIQADVNTAPRKPRKSRIVLDDEDSEDSEHEGQQSTGDADEDTRDPFAAFNFDVANNISLLSPTQAFNATMQTPTQATQEDSFDNLRHIAPRSVSSLPPMLPDLETQLDEDTQPMFVPGSQVPESQRIDLNWETQPPETPVPAAMNRGPSALAETPGWEPTQDPGLPSPWSVAPNMRQGGTLDPLDEHDTQSTVQLRVSESPAPSQNAPKRGRLGHKRAILEDDSDDEDVAPVASVRPEKGDAFREMTRRRKEALTATERADAEKEMRQMMDEQAEESEDEYAGLGGDDFVAPETEQDREMIDSSHVDVDERALAAHFAERQRQRDEAETSKLYKDLTTGVLRRKMGANAFDLDEDEDDLAVRRRQMRQIEEARKRKALLKDENIATLAEGKQSKGKDAFLKAIADDDGDDEVLNLSDEEGESIPATQEDSQQSQTEQPAPGPLRETSGNKRRLVEGEETTGDRPPAKQRRTQVSAFKRPTSLLEVKESVSFLLEEPHANAALGPSVLDFSSDSEKEDRDREPLSESDDADDVDAEEARVNDGGFAPNPISMEAKSMPPPRLPASQRRTAPKAAVVDRLSLKRGSSTSGSGVGRTAWAAGPTTGGFKAPSLLRRATTNTAGNANDRGVSTPSLSREGSGVKMGGSKKSSLAYQARAEERRAIVEASAKRREENTAKIAQLRRNSSALNRGLTGRFE